MRSDCNMPRIRFESVVLLVFIALDLTLALECKRRQETSRPAAVDSSCYRTCEYPAQRRVCEYTFNVEWTNTMSGHCKNCPFNVDDCYHEKCLSVNGASIIAAVVNGSYPGPSIEVCEGDTIRVKVINNLQCHSVLTIHWHGMSMKENNWMDGVPRVTQCPISSGSSFVYEFIAEPAGTHWWHAHTGYKRSTGLYGSLIVRKPKVNEFASNLYDLDLPEHVMMVSEAVTVSKFEQSIQGGVPARYDRPGNKSFIMNGIGELFDFVDATGQIFKPPIATFEVESGLRYRIRLIGAFGVVCKAAFYIEEHNMTVIATDGHEIIPKEAAAVRISSGDRLDLVIHANALPSTYCIHVIAVDFTACDFGGGIFMLKYKDSPIESPGCSPTITFNEGDPLAHLLITHNDLQSTEPIDPSLHHVDETLYLSIKAARTAYIQDVWYSEQQFARPMVNNIIFTLPKSPFVTHEPLPSEICEPATDKSLRDRCQKDKCFCTNVIKVKLGQVVEFVVMAVYAEPIHHPMHLHGNQFLNVGEGTFIEPIRPDEVIALDKQGHLPRKPLHEAVVKDTISVPDNGYVIIRWKADNPGYWLFHCHILVHGEKGMTAIVQVGEHSEMPNPPNDFPRCESWSP